MKRTSLLVALILTTSMTVGATIAHRSNSAPSTHSAQPSAPIQTSSNSVPEHPPTPSPHHPATPTPTSTTPTSTTPTPAPSENPPTRRRITLSDWVRWGGRFYRLRERMRQTELDSPVAVAHAKL